jgi:hypothetical protein
MEDTQRTEQRTITPPPSARFYVSSLLRAQRSRVGAADVVPLS